MDNSELTLTVDLPQPGHMHLTIESGGQIIADQETTYEGHVDNILLTTVDSLLKKSNLDRSALVVVKIGSGIDKNSSSYRIVQSFASAMAVANGKRP